MDDLNTRRRRAARNQSLFSEINERITALSDGYADELPSISDVCDWLNTCSAASLELITDGFRRRRKHGHSVLVLRGDEDLAVEDIETTDRNAVVEKIGVAKVISPSTAPRRRGGAS